jgi:hypothetical protein
MRSPLGRTTLIRRVAGFVNNKLVFAKAMPLLQSFSLIQVMKNLLGLPLLIQLLR